MVKTSMPCHVVAASRVTHVGRGRAERSDSRRPHACVVAAPHRTRLACAALAGHSGRMRLGEPWPAENTRGPRVRLPAAEKQRVRRGAEDGRKGRQRQQREGVEALALFPPLPLQPLGHPNLAGLPSPPGALEPPL